MQQLNFHFVYGSQEYSRETQSIAHITIICRISTSKCVLPTVISWNPGRCGWLFREEDSHQATQQISVKIKFALVTSYWTLAWLYISPWHSVHNLLFLYPFCWITDVEEQFLTCMQHNIIIVTFATGGRLGQCGDSLWGGGECRTRLGGMMDAAPAQTWRTRWMLHQTWRDGRCCTSSDLEDKVNAAPDLEGWWMLRLGGQGECCTRLRGGGGCCIFCLLNNLLISQHARQYFLILPQSHDMDWMNSCSGWTSFTMCMDYISIMQTKFNSLSRRYYRLYPKLMKSLLIRKQSYNMHSRSEEILILNYNVQSILQVN